MGIIWVVFKPTKHNKEYLKNRGLFSNDSQLIFDLYEEIMSDREFGIPQNDPSTPLLLKILNGLKY